MPILMPWLKRSEIAIGGELGEQAGFFYPPTVAVNANNNAEIAYNEVFGPTVTLSHIGRAKNARRIANARRYGLASTVLTKDVSMAMKMTSQLRCGKT